MSETLQRNIPFAPSNCSAMLNTSSVPGDRIFSPNLEIGSAGYPIGSTFPMRPMKSLYR